MAYKPGDFFLGVIDFFGIVVPGAVMLFLDGPRLREALNFQLPTDSVQQWTVFLVGSYVLGHFLLGAGVPLNHILRLYRPVKRDRSYERVKGSLNAELRGTPEEARTDAFYLAYSFVRLKSPAALSEIERQMADYKLFRSLALVFALDLAVNLWGHAWDWRLSLLSILLVLAAARYCFLLSWTYRITFDYYALLNASA